MSMFDKYTFFYGLPTVGQSIKFIAASKFCFFKNVIEDEKNLLIPGQTYTVKSVNLNSSSTYVYLEEFWEDGLDEYRYNQKFFNMSCFEWETPPFDPKKLIGFNSTDYINLDNDRYGHFGVEINGKVLKEGSPILELTTQSGEGYSRFIQDVIIDAKFKE